MDSVETDPDQFGRDEVVDLDLLRLAFGLRLATGLLAFLTSPTNSFWGVHVDDRLALSSCSTICYGWLNGPCPPGRVGPR